MKNYISLLLIFVITSCFSQIEQKNLYIFHSNEPDFFTTKSNDSLINLEIYHINFDLKKQRNYELKMNQDGNLIKSISLKGFSDIVFKFTYFNNNNNNSPQLIFKKNIVNALTYKEIIENISSENFKEIIKNFKNIYLINSKDIYENYFISKKVIVEIDTRL
ncbi:MAG: hypothetical protein ACJAQ1_001725 [Flavobacterium sp.]|jgi:hypothetical protein